MISIEQVGVPQAADALHTLSATPPHTHTHTHTLAFIIQPKSIHTPSKLTVGFSERTDEDPVSLFNGLILRPTPGGGGASAAAGSRVH